MRQKTLALLTTGIIFGGILLTMIIGIWTTENTKIPARYLDGSAKGEYNPEDIRGSYTFSEISTLFEVPSDTLIEAFNLASDTDLNTFKSKDLESLYVIDTPNVEIVNESVQVFVALYKDLPFVLSDSYLPAQAVDLLLSLDKDWSIETIAYLNAHRVMVKQAAFVVEATMKTTEHEEPLIKGTTTFQQLLDAGIEKVQIEQILDAKMPPTNMLVKDYCNQNGLPFSEVKAAIENLSSHN